MKKLFSVLFFLLVVFQSFGFCDQDFDAISNYYLNEIHKIYMGTGVARTDSLLYELIRSELGKQKLQDTTQIKVYDLADTILTIFVTKADSMILCNLDYGILQDSINAKLYGIDGSFTAAEETLNFIQNVIDDSVSSKLNLIEYNIAPKDTCLIRLFSSLAADSTFLIYYPGYPSFRWSYNFVRYTTNDGPIRFLLYFTSGRADTLDAPFTALNIGALGGFLPQPVVFSMELDSIRVTATGALSYLEVIWYAKHTLQ